MRIDHPTLDALHARARRERAQAVSQMLVVPLIRFVQRIFQARPAPARRTAPLRSRLA